MLVAKIVKGVFKIRYLVLGGALGGGVTLQKKYQQWKESLPNINWLDSFMSSENWDSFRGSMISIKDKVSDIEIDPRLRSLGEGKYRSVKEWLNDRLDEAYVAAEQARLASEQGVFMTDEFGILEKVLRDAKSHADSAFTANAISFGQMGSGNENEKVKLGRDKSEAAQKRIDNLQHELMEVQLKYQRELEKLEKDNKELRKQVLLYSMSKQPTKKIKKSLIDMYSDVLDELSGYDITYQTQDHLPRVVVVGDQSSGKTSVLEMIAQARIFPRGGGEMMTRAPVKVTLSEGPYHVAQFRDSSREFDLSKEEHLAELRKEVELRMKNSVHDGKTVSNEVISMTVKGPGLQRMVLVDLPGIISTVTVDMAEGTRESIHQMSEIHMSNPNAIILCIQDGSIDAERSNVTDLVSRMDPLGKRTIFVLTKVDLAEKNHSNPERIKKILNGKLFPMKALGYYAVVTGRGRTDESIQQIKDYEEAFFRNSKLFTDSLTMSSQVTTRNLSLAVAETFWKMVRETVEQQADAFKATRFNLETEWKNNFPRMRELDRDELFEKARGEILDETVSLSQVSVKHWEDLLMQKLWEKVAPYVFENIYLPGAQTGDPRMFNTTVDIKLREWAEKQLPVMSVEAGWEALKQEFSVFIEKSKQRKDHDNLFDNLKQAVINEALDRHTWEDKAQDMLRVLQVNTLEDRTVYEKAYWDQAVTFLQNSITDKLEATEKRLREMLGPSAKERWLYWCRTTVEQWQRNAVKSELEKIMHSDYHHTAVLSQDELTTVRKNLQRSNYDVDHEFIRETWRPVYKRSLLKQRLGTSYDCRKGYYLYRQGHQNEVDCSDVVLFWRIQQMLKVTAKALRQQIMNREAGRLYKEIKEVLEDFSQDQERKVKLLTGRRVILAEELKRVKQIQEKLEEFIQALNYEK